MKIKRFFAKDMRTALKEVKETLGPDAVIMSNKKLADGIELVAAVDESALVKGGPIAPEPSIAMPMAKMMRNHSSTEQAARDYAASFAAQPDSRESYGANNSGRPAPASRPAPAQERPASRMYRETSQVAEDNEDESSVSNSLEALLSRQSQQIKHQNDKSRLNPAFLQSARQEPSLAAARPAPAAQPNMDYELYKQQMEMMKTEMSSIRQLLTHQVSGLMWQDLERREPTRALLISRLKKMGLSETVADQTASFVPDGLADHEAWRMGIDLLQGQISTTNNEILTQGGIFALIGPTGVGKTTTVAKLAARFAQKHGSEQVGLVTTDTFRIGAHEQLATFGKIIGCPVKTAKDAEELANVLYQLRNRKLILIDTAGMSQRDIRLCEQLTTLMKNSRVKIKSYLVLSATVQYNVLQESVTHFKKIPLAGCIFTKIDECLSLGEIISIAMQNGLPIGYITTGQRVPEDIEVANSGQIISQAEALLEQTSNNEQHHQWFSVNTEHRAVEMYD